MEIWCTQGLYCNYLNSLCGHYLHVTIYINTTHTSKQNQSPKQNISKEMKPTCLIPSGQSWQNSHSWHRIDHRKHAHHWTTWSNRVEGLVSNLLSGGTLSLCGQPDRLRWWGYSPVTWPVPSQPGVGHRLSFLSTREASVN